MSKDVQQYATVRERICASEELFLSQYAVRSSQTQGRLRAEEPCEFRTEFQRDCDRIANRAVDCTDAVLKRGLGGGDCFRA